MKRSTFLFLSLTALVSLLLFNSHRLLASPTADPSLTIGSATAAPNTAVTLPITFDSGGNGISSLVFSVDFDPSLLLFDESDNNLDGIPDAIDFNVPVSFAPSVTYDAADSDGELDFAIFDFAPPLASLPNGVIATMTFMTADVGSETVTAVNFSTDPPPSFGSNTGQSIPGTTTGGTVTITGVGTETPTPTASPTPTETTTVTPTNTPTGTLTATPIATLTPTPSATPLPSSGNKLFMPVIKREHPTAVFGRVTNQQGQGMAGVVIATNTGKTATTDANGNYILGPLTAGSYTLTPSKANYTFNPAARPIFVPPNAKSQDFTANAIATVTPTPTNTPQPGPSKTPKPNPTNTPQPSCTDYMGNGGFESSSHWVINNNEYPASYSTVQSHSGSRSMRVGVINPADNQFAYSSVSQTLTLPSSATDATLRFWLYTSSTGTLVKPEKTAVIPTSANETSLNDDAQYVLAYDGHGNQYTLLFQRSNQGWTQYQANLGSLAGQQITLYFGVYNNGFGGVTGMYVDDVEVISCR